MEKKMRESAVKPIDLDLERNEAKGFLSIQ